MNKEDDCRSPISVAYTIPETSIEVVIRNIRMDDIKKRSDKKLKTKIWILYFKPTYQKLMIY
jgi:hypothetical protein